MGLESSGTLRLAVVGTLLPGVAFCMYIGVHVCKHVTCIGVSMFTEVQELRILASPGALAKFSGEYMWDYLWNIWQHEVVSISGNKMPRVGLKSSGTLRLVAAGALLQGVASRAQELRILLSLERWQDFVMLV